MRLELAARNLSSKGLKSQLLARLTKAIKSEQAKEEGRQDDAEENEEEVAVPSKDEVREEKKSKEVRNYLKFNFITPTFETTKIIVNFF